MKRFSSYGPPEPDNELMIERPELVAKITEQLIGKPGKGGHYFTIFAPRQRGKSTTLRSVAQHIEQQYPGQFHVGMDILHLVQDLRTSFIRIIARSFQREAPSFDSWDDVHFFFSKRGPLTKPVILILDEFDALPQSTLEDSIAFFRACYHHRDDNWLHGVALIGVHSSLGKLEGRTSPFNVQRAVNVPNFTREEVFELYGQYIAESGQAIAPEGLERIYDQFRGQPGLTCWFGELLTEKYNWVQPPPCERKEGPPPEGFPLITRDEVERVLTLAQFSEININIRNLISKGMQHQTLLRELFINHEMPFDLNDPDLQWLYLNGIVIGRADSEVSQQEVCAFASPFVQRCLFSAFGRDLKRTYKWAYLVTVDEAVPLGQAILHMDVPALLQHYRRFLLRRAAQGDAPWSDQPVRSDARAFEAIGHFNLYAWLFGVVQNGFSIVPEFPTGNGTADLLLTHRRKGQQEVLEIKSFTTTSDLGEALSQVKRYARKLKLSRAYLVVMADASAYSLLSQQPKRYDEEGLELSLEIIPWGFVPGLRPTDAEGPVSARLDGLSVAQGALTASGLPSHVDATALASSPQETRSQKGTGKTQGSASRKAKTRAPQLAFEDRLALEDRVLPHLSQEAVKSAWLKLGFPLNELLEESLQLQWDQLVARTLAKGKLTMLLLVLIRLIPGLESDPLVMRLRQPPPS